MLSDRTAFVLDHQAHSKFVGDTGEGGYGHVISSMEGWTTAQCYQRSAALDCCEASART